MPLRVGLSRSIFPGAVKRTVSIHPAPRAQKGYLRISLTHPASCIEKISPAIIATQRVSSARAPESWAHRQPQKLTAEMTSLRTADRICGNLQNHAAMNCSETIPSPDRGIRPNKIKKRNLWTDIPRRKNLLAKTPASSAQKKPCTSTTLIQGSRLNR